MSSDEGQGRRAGRPRAVSRVRREQAAKADVPLFARLLAPRNPPAVQPAVAALGHIASPEAADALLPAWKGMSPRVRGWAADAVIGRAAWTARLLAAVGGSSRFRGVRRGPFRSGVVF